ncbi:MAG: hypothetical protein IKZ12_06270 [Alistipes sp.]|nr:hypothetical protein [Alistipes sp.]
MKKLVILLAAFTIGISAVSAAPTTQTPERKEVSERKPVDQRKPMSERKAPDQRKPANKNKQAQPTDSLKQQEVKTNK